MRRPRCNGKFNGRAEQMDLQRTAFPKKAGPRLTFPTPPPKSPVGGDRGRFAPHTPQRTTCSESEKAFSSRNFGRCENFGLWRQLSNAHWRRCHRSIPR